MDPSGAAGTGRDGAGHLGDMDLSADGADVGVHDADVPAPRRRERRLHVPGDGRHGALRRCHAAGAADAPLQRAQAAPEGRAPRLPPLPGADPQAGPGHHRGAAAGAGLAPPGARLAALAGPHLAPVGTPPGGRGLRRGPARGRRTAARPHPEPGLHPPGGGPRTALRARPAPLRPRLLHDPRTTPRSLPALLGPDPAAHRGDTRRGARRHRWPRRTRRPVVRDGRRGRERRTGRRPRRRRTGRRPRRRAGTRPGARRARAARGVPRARGAVARPVRQRRPAARLGVGQVAAARAAPVRGGRRRQGPPDHRRPRRAGRPARCRVRRAPRFRPGRPPRPRRALHRRRPGRRHRPRGPPLGGSRLPQRRGPRRRRGAALAARPQHAAADRRARAGKPGAHRPQPQGAFRAARPAGPARPARRGVTGQAARPRRMSLGADVAQPLDTDVELTTLLGIPDLHRHEPRTLFDRHTGSARLRVPIAVGVDGRPVELDIKESAQGGMGPHGMLIGATGSGKSELLRTLVLGLALTNSSETLNFVLVDFKGGATFLGLEELPHTSAVITNLADEVALVERMQDALHGELIRRQELLRSAGNYTSALEYERARAAGAALTPLPSLFVVVDEFSELLSTHREFMDLFVMIGRLGRSLGVHLLLASQRLDEGRMHQLESHLSYRVGLRTFSAMESRGVLGVPDAYELPAQPGSGYLKSGVESLTRFRAAYSSGTYRRRTGAVVQARVASQVVPWTSGWVVPRTLEATPEPEPETGATGEGDDEETLLDVALDRLRGSGPPAHQVWLPPLDEPFPLDALLPGIAPDPERGLGAVGWSGTGRLRVPVGLVDRPFEQRRDPLVVDLSGAGGHVAVAGGSQSGKSTLARTLIAALALTHTPAEVQFYCLDFGGGGLSQLAALPHVGGVAPRLNPERVHRAVAEVMTLLARREQFFVDHTLDSMQSYRRRRAAGEFPDEPFGDVFLVVDGWSTVRQDYDDLVPKFNEIAARGLNYGIHLIVTTTRWVELSAQVRDQAATRLELRMGDPMDSEIDTRKARSVPRTGGRGITSDSRMHFLAGLPRLDGSGSLDDLGDGVAHLVAEVARHWPGAPAPRIRMLPHRLPLSELPAPQGTEGAACGCRSASTRTPWSRSGTTSAAPRT
ncbi:type VII secretion protein EccCb [Streptomyces sp. Tue 6430]|nr:type VII secretion protein EccCb [Streptomyces sp. Tue 6430]